MEMEVMLSKRITRYFLFLLLLVTSTIHHGAAFGFDSANSCSPNKMSRRGRAQLVATIPCDLSRQSYCHLPGAAYPWHAVRRFVHENQGLMKRMYGDVKHISILRNEIQNNDIDIEDLEQTAARYSRDGFRRTKILHNQFDNARVNEVLKEPHFRPVTSTTTQSSTSIVTTMEIMTTVTDATTTNISTEPATVAAENLLPATEQPKEVTRRITPPPLTEPFKRFTLQLDDVELDDEDDDDDDDDEQSIESNSVYEPTSMVSATQGDNIKIVESPNLGLGNLTESATISTTLKLVPQITGNEPAAPPTTIHSTSKNKISETISLIANMTNMRVDGISVTTPLKVSTNNSASVSTNSIQSLYNNAPTEPTNTKVTQIKKQPVTTAATKPVLRDGQLFQDTIQKEPVQVANLRGVNACPVKEEVVAPFWANNTRGEVLALLNLYPFEQYVHWEKCTHEHRQMYCRDGCRCEQQYRLHRLLAYDPHNECRGIFSDWFRFPSCCICKCYDIPADFRATSRSPRSESDYRHPVEVAEAEVRRAVYEHASEDWYRPREDLDLYD